MVASDDAVSLDDVLNGTYVRELRITALSWIGKGVTLRHSHPTKADVLIQGAMRLKAQADEIEWLAQRYVRLGQEIEFWTRVVESPQEYVRMITGINP